jgi:hypothetical protein
MEKKLLAPRKIINVKGKIYYNESKQAWTNIKFTKEFLNEFPDLKEKRSSFSYKLKFFRDFIELEGMIKELKKNENTPILMWLYKES